jgi:TPR repeat protein
MLLSKSVFLRILSLVAVACMLYQAPAIADEVDHQGATASRAAKSDSNSDDADDSDDDNASDDKQTDGDVSAATKAISQAIDAFKAGDYPTAIKLFSDAANADHDPRGQYDLAKMLISGTGTTEDDTAALNLFKKAARARSGNEKFKADAESAVGIMYAKGWGASQDLAKATHWTQRSAEHGNEEAKSNLAVLKAPGKSPTEKSNALHTPIQSHEREAPKKEAPKK